MSPFFLVRVNPPSPKCLALVVTAFSMVVVCAQKCKQSWRLKLRPSIELVERGRRERELDLFSQ